MNKRTLRTLRRIVVSIVVVVLLVVLYQAGEGSRRQFERDTSNTICMLTQRC